MKVQFVWVRGITFHLVNNTKLGFPPYWVLDRGVFREQHHTTPRTFRVINREDEFVYNAEEIV